jgi:hypothetical protein
MIMADSSPGRDNPYRARASARPIPVPPPATPPWVAPRRGDLASGFPARSVQNAAPGTYRKPRRPVDAVRHQDDDRAARRPVQHPVEYPTAYLSDHPVEYPRDSSAWHWLLWLPVLLPLITPVYNRVEPRWAGVPFFYWFQLSLVALDITVVTFVYQVTKRRSLS